MKKTIRSSQRLTCSIEENVISIRKAFENDETIIYKMLDLQNAKFAIIFIESLSSENIINEEIIKPIMRKDWERCIDKKRAVDFAMNEVITCRGLIKSNELKKLVESILSGDTLLLIDQSNEALIISTKEWSRRSITEPESERVVKGPREGFTETLKENISFIRRRVLSTDLKFKYLTIGAITKTKICICYIDGVASLKILKELEERLSHIEIDGVLCSEMISELIKDSPFSIYKTIGDTERPDTLVGKLLEGRIALLCDGTPSVITVPFLFLEYFQTSEDYYNNYIYASINRVLRIFSYLFTISFPAIYLSIVAFHKEMIPTSLLLSFAAARKDVPFPSIIEMVLMLLFFELLREAGIRLPVAVGQGVSIVGALVLGEAAVAAKIVSAPIVIVMAATGISSFLIPQMKGPTIVVRTLFLLSASVLGLYGYMVSFLVLVTYLMSIRSFGINYMTNTTLIDLDEIKDTSVRAPSWTIEYGPKFSTKRRKNTSNKAYRR